MYHLIFFHILYHNLSAGDGFHHLFNYIFHKERKVVKSLQLATV